MAFVSILVAIKAVSQASDTFKVKIVEPTFPTTTTIAPTFTDYVTALRAQRVCIDSPFGNDGDGIADMEISGISNQGWNWPVPLVKCDSRMCTKFGENALPFCEFAIVALAGTNDGGKTRANEFKAWVEENYPALPFDFDVFRVFESSGAMDTYIQQSDYGSPAKPKIAMGIVWDGSDAANYRYELRPNSTNFNAPEAEARPGTQTMPTTKKVVNNFARDDDACAPIGGTADQGPLQNSCMGQYMYNGVLTFQRLIHDFILEQSGAVDAGYKVAEASVQFTPFPTKEFKTSGFFDTIQGERV